MGGSLSPLFVSGPWTDDTEGQKGAEFGRVPCRVGRELTNVENRGGRRFVPRGFGHFRYTLGQQVVAPFFTRTKAFREFERDNVSLTHQGGPLAPFFLQVDCPVDAATAATKRGSQGVTGKETVWCGCEPGVCTVGTMASVTPVRTTG